MPAARMKRSVGDCLFFLVERDFYENLRPGLDTLSAPQNPGDFTPGDHRGARPKVLQNFAGPFRTP